MTRLEESRIISKYLRIKLFFKRDDLYPVAGGGNKARKLDYILKNKVKKKYNAIVTAGSDQSNHIRATALYSSMLGWKTICIIHDNCPKKYEGNLKIAGLAGAELRFVNKNDVKASMDIAMEDLRLKGFNPLYIWGGGHCLEGAYAYFKAVHELKRQLGSVTPDFIFLASGTGTTQAGIEIGVRRFLPGCQVIGISIARKKERGKDAVLSSMNELNSFIANPVSNTDEIVFDDAWIGNSYGLVYPEMIKTIKWTAKSEGILLDPTYTGKAFHALVEYVRNGFVKENSKVVFWHTGGLLNLLSSKYI